MALKPIVPHNISCASALHDSCGVVFQYQGHIFRALSPRGEHIVDMLRNNFDVEELARLGLVIPAKTEFDFPGYALVESCSAKPVIPPNMWTVEMVGQAALVIIRLCRALLKRGLVLWDLKGLHNMTFHHVRGPLFLDIGAIHYLQELEEGRLSTSYASLLDQIVDSFYLPLWLATGVWRKNGFIRRLLNAKRVELEDGIARGVLSRLTFSGKAVPGYFECNRLLKNREIESLYSFLENRIIKFLVAHKANQSQVSKPLHRSTWSVSKDHLNVLHPIVESGEVIIDLDPYGSSYGRFPSFAGCGRYLVFDKAEWPADPMAPNQDCSSDQFLVPLLFDPWDRSMRSLESLANSGDLVVVMSDIYDFCSRKKIPIDFFGRVAFRLSRRYLLLVVLPDSNSGEWPGFVSYPIGSTPTDFIKLVIGKYFHCLKDIHLEGDSAKSTLLLFEKRSRQQE